MDGGRVSLLQKPRGSPLPGILGDQPSTAVDPSRAPPLRRRQHYGNRNVLAIAS